MKTKIHDSLTIQQYLEGKLDPELAHQLEKQALEDPFLWDALEGYSVYRDPAADLSILQRQLHERIVHLQENKKVFDLSWQRLSVAAAAAVMFVSAGILFWMNSQKSPEQLASQTQKPVEVNIIDRDSVESVIRAKDETVIASLERKESDLDRSRVEAYKPAQPIENKAIISARPESTTAANSQSVLQTKVQARNMAAASATPDVRQAKVARIGDNAGTLNEVVVTGNYTPKPGWRSYREYLDLNTKKFVSDPRLTGSVLLSFEVGSDGKLTNVKVIKGLSQTYDQEAIRIIKNGSEWLPPADGKTYVSQIELRFQ